MAEEQAGHFGGHFLDGLGDGGEAGAGYVGGFAVVEADYGDVVGDRAAVVS